MPLSTTFQQHPPEFQLVTTILVSATFSPRGEAPSVSARRAAACRMYIHDQVPRGRRLSIFNSHLARVRLGQEQEIVYDPSHPVDLFQVAHKDPSVLLALLSFLRATSVSPLRIVSGVFNSWDTSTLNWLIRWKASCSLPIISLNVCASFPSSSFLGPMSIRSSEVAEKISLRPSS